LVAVLAEIDVLSKFCFKVDIIERRLSFGVAETVLSPSVSDEVSKLELSFFVG